MTILHVIEILLAMTMLLGPATLIYHRLKPRTKDDDSPRGIGVRVLQLIALLLLVPAVVILALEAKLSNEGLGTILGVIIGYTLSGVNDPVPGKRDDKSSDGDGGIA